MKTLIGIINALILTSLILMSCGIERRAEDQVEAVTWILVDKEPTFRADKGDCFWLVWKDKNNRIHRQGPFIAAITDRHPLGELHVNFDKR